MQRSVAFRREGGDVLPVVFVHGIRLSGACWQQQKRLARGRVAAPDLPGHGARRGEKFTLDGAVGAVAAAVDEVGGRAVLVGHSLGGYVSIAAAARHPERVVSLVGAGCSLVPSSALRGGFRFAHRGLATTADDGASFSAWLLRRVLPAEVAEPVIAAGIASEVIPDVMEAAAGMDPLADLARYPGRVLLLNGRHDHFRLGERRFLAACQDGALQIVPGAGHYLPLTHGEGCARVVKGL
ncbi:alpha/beta hydrolase [Amycolatopsis rubida]|uniref:Alpha/beta hydrolase n=1 Tax=Amycolatopsis rubida TaxID=112413 RepID=A0ABX0BQ97_9PSEU|nr:alpha/beta hydrolase [Amycolatopsis rubida]MYW92142.1 alpha/beta fold hydrolase [Amycolatopsis rubida]NEC57129.1 alpha/beta hydrolase [Amycolatopsis rubida]